MQRGTIVFVLGLAAGCGLFGQPEPQQSDPQNPAPPAFTGRGGFGSTPQEPQPYEKVITKDAKSKKGVFTVHQIKERYYFEIPKPELDKEFLWNTQIAKTIDGAGYGGQEISNRVIRWELNGNRLNLRYISYNVVADPASPIASAVRAANNDVIIMTFPVAAFGPEGAPVIDVTRLFTSDISEFSARQRLGATGMDPSRSFIERISPFPENIETEQSVTYTRSQSTFGSGGGSTMFGNSAMRPGSATVVLHHSMVKLPEHPMLPRIFDERIGYFSISQIDYSREEHRASHVRFITRWRLEKRDPSAALSEPVKPIVYYIDAATPAKWRDWLKKGVESWQPAFEAAGFKNAIVAKMAPSAAEDPDFSPEDVRNSVIRWLPSTIENASGPHISDPRTGEILNADIQFYHNVMNLQRSWYFLQVGPLDPRAQTLPLPDDLMGRLLQFVVAHEVGHTLGLQHNMKASSMYPADKVHDPRWVHEMGFSPSIMDYARFDYVAQPEDHIPVEDLIPRPGPYDQWAIGWGYRPIDGTKTAEQEKPVLDQWARQQDATPWYRFSTMESAGSDPGELAEAVGDADAIQSTALGLKNLRRVAKLLLPATTARQGDSFDDLGELYGRMLGQWTTEMNHVAQIVGGFDSQEKHVGQHGPVFTPVPRQRQKAALNFLAENAFSPPTWAVDPEILRRIEPVGVLGRIRNAQTAILSTLLNSGRFSRLVEEEALDGSTAYAPFEFLGDVRHAVWTELGNQRPQVDAYRRNLQRAYLEIVNTKLNGSAGSGNGDEKAFYREELRRLRASVDEVLPKIADRETRAHLEGVKDQIVRILDPRFAPAPPRTTFELPAIRSDSDDLCWHDYTILP